MSAVSDLLDERVDPQQRADASRQVRSIFQNSFPHQDSLGGGGGAVNGHNSSSRALTRKKKKAQLSH